ncbi:tetratricopeptide repeat protein [Endozoicomonas sp. OPT23]|uniref:tetratricopeptide repeat protein n=1 Tax=Endozoicomonas sp. OPT23 TaxID=2072845 RepID=UPI001890EA6F|nr:SEL1-like repeat protein [Endozoicomonas sp. OPT23]
MGFQGKVSKRLLQGVLATVLVTTSIAGQAGEFNDLLKKASGGDVESSLMAGKQMLTGKLDQVVPDQMVDLLEPLAQKGNAEAQLLLAKAYRSGLAGVGKDKKKSFKLLEDAAGKKGKLPEAQYELGKSYYMGSGTDRNLIAAYMWTTVSLAGANDNFAQQAMEQKKNLAAQLNPEQLKKANELALQIKDLYLH